MWLGPPYMNRKMTLFAFGAKCGFFGASGLTNFVRPSAAADCAAKKSSPSRPARATEAKPPPACQRNSRRVRPQKLACFMRYPLQAHGSQPAGFLRSIQVDKLVQ